MLFEANLVLTATVLECSNSLRMLQDKYTHVIRLDVITLPSVEKAMLGGTKILVSVTKILIVKTNDLH